MVQAAGISRAPWPLRCMPLACALRAGTGRYGWRVLLRGSRNLRGSAKGTAQVVNTGKQDTQTETASRILPQCPCTSQAWQMQLPWQCVTCPALRQRAPLKHRPDQTCPIHTAALARILTPSAFGCQGS